MLAGLSSGGAIHAKGSFEMTEETAFHSTPLAIEKDWIDYNRHLNMAYYAVLFDRIADQAFERFGIDADYPAARGRSIYTAEFHVCYLRELHLEDPVWGTVQIIGHDDRRVHYYQELRHADGWLSATAEVLSVHVDPSIPGSAPFPPDVAAHLAAMAERHALLPRPERIGRVIGIRRRTEAGAVQRDSGGHASVPSPARNR